MAARQSESSHSRHIGLSVTSNESACKSTQAGKNSAEVSHDFTTFCYSIESIMKVISALVLAAAAAQSSAFVVPATGSGAVVSSTNLQMGLFDFFSEDARKEREARRQAEIEEQERLQREIIERRKNPEKMEEYEAKVKVRRALRMAGEDEMASTVQMFDDEKKE